MQIIWTSVSITIREELRADVKVSATAVIFGTYNDQVQASDLVLTPDQADAIADLLMAGAARARAAQERRP